jgi:hypothetical protein
LTYTSGAVTSPLPELPFIAGHGFWMVVGSPGTGGSSSVSRSRVGVTRSTTVESWNGR